MQLDDTAKILADAEFFDLCDAEQRRLLAFAAERRKYRPGTVLYASGDIPDGAHVLISGTVTSIQDDSPDTPQLTNRPGSLIGMVSLVIDKPRHITVKAVDSVETVLVPRGAFMKLARQSPDLAARAAQRFRAEMVGYLDVIETFRGRIQK
jgi:CRP-like cAMP-binding protein